MTRDEHVDIQLPLRQTQRRRVAPGDDLRIRGLAVWVDPCLQANLVAVAQANAESADRDDLGLRVSGGLGMAGLG